jgi:hypothetical protein
MDLSSHFGSQSRPDTPPMSVPVPPTEPRRGSRSKRWDLHPKHHRPVIGTRLEIGELRRIAERTRIPSDGRLSDFEVHSSFFSAADSKNSLSIATHQALEPKYSAAVRRFAKVRASAGLLALWREELATGSAPAGLWALVTHAHVDAQVQATVCGDIHMLSHRIAAG